MATNEDANTKPSEGAAKSLDALCGYSPGGYHETQLAVRRMAATVIAQDSFRETYMRYMGVSRDQG